MARLRNPFTIKCECCGAELWIDDALWNTCDKCGALYNGFGQKLEDGCDDINHPCHDGKVF